MEMRSALRTAPLATRSSDRRTYLVTAAVCLAVLIAGMVVVADGTVPDAEASVFRAINGLPGWLYPVAWPLQQIGALLAGPVVVVVALVLHRWRLAIAAALVTVGKLVGERIVKALVSRERPGTSIGSDVISRGDVPLSGESFVSGHAVLVAALAGVITPYLSRTVARRAMGRGRRGDGGPRLRRRPQPARRRLRRRARHAPRGARQPGAARAHPRPSGRAVNLESPSHDIAHDVVSADPVSSAHVRDRRRRPTGAPPPLPRSLGWTGKAWGIGLLALSGTMAVVIAWDPSRRALERADATILRGFAAARTGWLSSAARAIDRVATGYVLGAVIVALLVATVAFRRWRHCFTFVGSFIAVVLACTLALEMFERPRPYDVTTIGRWFGYAAPSTRVAIASLTAVGIVYMLVVPGRPRGIAKWVAAASVALVVLARLLLGIDRLTDAVAGIVFGVAIPLMAFRFFTPTEVIPVTYGGGKTAHLDVSGRRGEAIRRAVEDQLGMTVLDVRHVGLAGSGGSTPLRLVVAGEPDTVLFGKLYAMSHVRSDRWYKAGRTILYGRLEDERSFQSVRRLVQYEDYLLRVMRDAGIPTAAPLGIVELTPEREYMLLTEMFDGAEEIGDAEVDDTLIDEGLMLVRKLWDAGLAHRDIKPANLLVSDGHLVLIDVAFAQVRPSPWRQAVDLANMMLVLAVRTDAERVYRRALAYFTPDEMAEAFAAARGVASPTQLRIGAQARRARPAGRDAGAGATPAPDLAPALGSPPDRDAPRCRAARDLRGPEPVRDVGPADRAHHRRAPHLWHRRHDGAARPGGPERPGCALRGRPAGGVERREVRAINGEARFWLDSDRAGKHAILVRSTAECDGVSGPEVDSDEPGWRRYDGQATEDQLCAPTSRRVGASRSSTSV